MLALAEIVKARRGHAVRVRPSSRGGLLVDRDGVPLGQVKGMKVEARTYECECGYWHLTSQPKRALVAWIDGV